MICYLFFAALMLKTVHLLTTTLSKDESSPYKCGTKLVLRCDISGSCCDNTITWTKNDENIVLANSSKYSQELFPNSSYITLTIDDFSKSDLGAKYGCQYSVAPLSTIQVKGSIHCNKCGGFGFLWILIGVIVPCLICVLIVYFKVKPKWNMNKIIVTAMVSILISLVVSGAIAVPVCIVESLCLNSPRLDPLFILLGLAVELGLFFILGICIGKPPKGSGGADSSGSRPPQGVRRPEIRESAQAGAHTRTENSSPKKNEYASKLDSVPKGRPLPQIGGNSPRELPQLDQGKNNITKLDPLVVFEDPGEKKKKKKKRKKQQENDEVET